jgi:sensor domain CHASE-containing protein
MRRRTRKKIIKIAWIILAAIVIFSMVAWTIMISFV